MRFVYHPRVLLESVVVGALLAGFFALAGAFLGPLLKARQDEVQWRRDRRMDAYAELYRALVELLIAVDEQGRGGRSNARQALDTYMRADTRVRLLGHKNVRDAVRKMGLRVSELTSRDDPELSQGLSDEEIEEIYKLHGAFAEAARRDLCVG